MALDPSISLQAGNYNKDGVNPVIAGMQNGIDIQAKQQNIAASKASMANTQAQLPGIQADSEFKQRALKYNQWLQANKDKFTNPDGSRDMNKLINASVEAGFNTEAQAVAAHDLTNQAGQIKNSQDVATFVKNAHDHAANLIAGLPPEKQATALKQYAEFLESKMPGAGAQLMQSFATVGQNGQPAVDQDRIAAQRQSTMSPLEQENLQMAKDNQKQTFAASGFNPKAPQDENAAVSAIYKLAADNGQPLPPGLSLFDLKQRFPDLAAQVTQGYGNQQVPQGTRAGALGDTARIGAIVQSYDSAINALGGVANKDMMGSKLGTIGSAAWNKFVTQVPGMSGLATALQVHNSQFPNDQIDPTQLTVAQIKAKLEAGKKMLQAQQAGAGAVAGSQRLPTASDVPQAAPQAAPKSPAAAPAKSSNTGTPAGTVRMQAPNGKLYNIPAARVKEALADGLKQVK